MRKRSTILGLAAGLSVGFVAGKRLFRFRRRRIAGPRYVIINADDFGMSDGITRGIIKAWREGVVTSTSAIVNTAGGPERIAAAHVAYPDLPIGLHLNITTGRPVLPSEEVPTLVDEAGQFRTTGTILEHLANISLAELRAELHAQAKVLLDGGVQFDHIDYHHHLLVVYGPFFGLVRELACEYGVPVRQPVPEAVYGQIKLNGGRQNNVVVARKFLNFLLRRPHLAIPLIPHVIPTAYQKHATLLDADGIKTTNWLVTTLLRRASVDNFISVLRQLPPGVSEIVMHPGLADDQLRSITGENYIEERSVELSVLLDPRVREALGRYDIRLVDFSILARN
ncbi:MAG: carbohydrate deacetylase [Anaerolineae bacterium]